MEKGIGLIPGSGTSRAMRLAALYLGFGVLALSSGVQAQSPEGEKKESPFYCNIKVLSVTERAHKKQIGEKWPLRKLRPRSCQTAMRTDIGPAESLSWN